MSNVKQIPKHYHHDAIMRINEYAGTGFKVRIRFEYIGEEDAQMSLAGLVNDYNTARPCSAYTVEKRGRELYKIVSDRLFCLVNFLLSDLKQPLSVGQNLWIDFEFRGISLRFHSFRIKYILYRIDVNSTTTVEVSFEDYFANGSNEMLKLARPKKAKRASPR